MNFITQTKKQNNNVLPNANFLSLKGKGAGPDFVD